MKITLVHFSDIHFREGENHLNNKTESLKKALNQIDLDCQHIIIAITGDIAFSGKKEEYEIANVFFQDIAKSLTRYKVTFLAAPGNHDCYFRPNKFRDLCLKHTEDFLANIDSEELAACCEPQLEFFKMIKSEPFSMHWEDSKLSNITHINIDKFKISIQCLNTSWCSSLPEKQSLVFPTDQIFEPDQDTKFAITLMHHALPWYESNNGRNLFKTLEQYFHLILVGHQHDAGAYNKKNILNDSSSIYLEGGVLQERDLPNSSSFHRLDIDLESMNYKLTTYDWESLEKLYQIKFTKESCLSCHSKASIDEFKLTSEFTAYLDDVGTGFTHPKKNTLSFNDLFVPPDLMLNDKLTGKDRIIYSKNALSYLKDQAKIIISGGELTGKTSISKWLFKELHTAGLFPILIDDNNTLDINPKNIDRAISKSITSSYENTDLIKWKSIEGNKRVIIVDDFNAKQLNRSGYMKIINHLESYSDKIILMVDNAFDIEEALRSNEEEKYLEQPISDLSDFKRLEIRLFRKRLRFELIKKWIRLGREFEITDTQENHEAEIIAEQVDGIIQKDLVQPCPLFVLSIIQILQSNQSFQMSSYGHVYHKLINDKVLIPSWAKDSGITIDIIETLLSQIAYSQHLEETNSIDSNIISKIHVDYCREFSIRFSLQNFIEILQENGLISSVGQAYRFKYKYIYYYFVAKYYQNGLASAKKTPGIREKLSAMARSLHNEDNSNILMFFVYFTKDEITITQMVEYAKSLYKDYALLTIESDAHALCDNPELLPSIQLGSSDVKRNKETTLKSLDDEEEKLYSQQKKDHNGHPSKEKHEEVEEIIRVNSTLKTMQMLGHMLRNFPGSLDKDAKSNIAIEGISLGLRLLKFIFSELSEHRDELREEFNKIIEKRKAGLSSTEKDYQIKSLFSILGVQLIIGGIKTITTNIGAPLLSSTFEDVTVTLQNDTVDFIDFAIKLDYAHPFPKADIIAFGKKYKDDVIKNHIGARLVGLYFFLHEHDLHEKQEVCSAFNIKFSQSKTASDTLHDVAEQVATLNTQPMVEHYLQLTRKKKEIPPAIKP